jgi:hypothetical protein
LIPEYIDTLALFISNINEKHIAQVVVTQFKSFMSLIGKHLSANQWNSFVQSLQNLFEATIPQSLIDERDRYFESEMLKKQGKPLNEGEEAQALPFNQDACFTKCIV